MSSVQGLLIPTSSHLTVPQCTSTLPKPCVLIQSEVLYPAAGTAVQVPRFRKALFVTHLPFSEQSSKVDVIVPHFVHKEAQRDERRTERHN